MTRNELTSKIIDAVIFIVCYWAIALIVSLTGMIISVYYYNNDEIDNAIWWFNLHIYIATIIVVIGTIVVLWKLIKIKKLTKESSG